MCGSDQSGRMVLSRECEDDHGCSDLVRLGEKRESLVLPLLATLPQVKIRAADDDQ